MDAIKNWGVPTTVRELRTFLGTVNFYRPFVQRLSVTAKPLFDLTKKATKFTWTEEADEAFGKIKEIIAQDIVLMFPDPNKAFHLHFDSSDVGTGAVLQQFDQNNRLRPLEFFSQKFAYAYALGSIGNFANSGPYSGYGSLYGQNTQAFGLKDTIGNGRYYNAYAVAPYGGYGGY
ncbi:hypothetical protein SeLEV6574_g07767 [Synchytrium endobioticum]|uniref:Reverse transcriptase/retrotransposon-derived protein RNase H-like domain-containing protein n=1 Tax=Synchytrium endobioticum TaxID=286115 RepID=A0A507CFS9_9FUNG|nr:hypothetical protein SeLEV6574_g07767 [Synchytrium endobioticum]